MFVSLVWIYLRCSKSTRAKNDIFAGSHLPTDSGMSGMRTENNTHNCFLDPSIIGAVL